jgi:hypothetical protein
MLEDGVYFSLPEAEYHSDSALGSGDHQQLLIRPVRFQYKRLAAWRESIGLGDDVRIDRTETLAQMLGTAAHVVTLMGLEEFENAYGTREDPPEGYAEDIEHIRQGLMATGDRDAIRLAGGMPKQAKRIEWVMLAKRFDVLTVEDWREGEDVRLAGKIVISKGWDARLRLIGRMLDVPRPDFDGLSIREKYLSEGMAEVSIFWTTEEGVRCKARIDWLRIAGMIDVKTHSGRDDLEPIESFARHIGTFGCDMQAAHYIDARAQLPRLVAEGRVFGAHDAGWLAAVAAHEKPAWAWIAIDTICPLELDIVEFPDELVMASAWSQVQQARKNYVTYRDLYGEDQPWVANRGRVVMHDEVFAFPPTNRGAARWTPA